MYVFFVILSMVSLVSGASLAKTLFLNLGAETTSLARLFTATIFMFLFWKPWKHKINKEQLKQIALYGACLGFMNLTFYLAISRLPIGLAIAIEFLGPLFIAIINSKKKLDFIWVLLAGIGVYLILPLNNFSQNIDWLGALFAGIAAACWALYIVLGRTTAQIAPTALAAPFGMLFGLIAVSPFGFEKINMFTQDHHLILMACGVGLLSSAIPYSLEMVALRHIKPLPFSLLLSMEPAIGSLAAYLFLNETLTGIQLLAVGCIILASGGSTLTSYLRSEPEV